MQIRIMLLGLALTIASLSVAAQELLVTYQSGNRWDKVNKTTAVSTSNGTLTIAGGTIGGTNGLAMDPTSGLVYVVLQSTTAASRLLATMNTTTGVCTAVGPLGDNVATIAFDAAGTLYAVTGDGATVPETMYTVNKTTAVKTLFVALGNGADGEVIGYNPVNGLMYHTSGNGSPIFETINLTTMAITNIPAITWGIEQTAFAWDAVAGLFYSTDIAGNLVTITTAGARTVVGVPNGAAYPKGLCFLNPPQPAINTSTANLNLGVTTQGTASTSVNFTVGGTNLTADLTVTGFTGVVVSLMPAAAFGPSVNLTPVAGTVATTTIYTRIQASAPQGPISGNIVVASTGATSVNIAATGQVDPPPVPEMDVMRGANPIADGGIDAQGTQAAGSPLSLNYSIMNTGAVPLNLSGTPRVLVTAGANLNSVAVMAQPPVSVAAAGTVNFTINYEVTTTGAFDFTVSIDNDDSDENPYNWTVSGTGQGAPEIGVTRVPSAIADGGMDAAGNRVIGTAFTLTYDIDNSGTDVLTIIPPVTVANTVGCSVLVSMQPGSPVAIASSTQVVLSVTPSVLGAFSFDVSIDNNDANENPYDWSVSGTGFGVPEISVAQGGVGVPDGSTESLGSNPAGQAINRAYDISNIGTDTLNITLPVVTAAATNCVVTVTTQPAATVAPSSSTQFVISVTPSAAGAFSFTVSFDNDDADEDPYNFTVTGTATAVGSPGSGGGGGGGGSCAAGFGAPAAVASALLPVMFMRRRKLAGR